MCLKRGELENLTTKCGWLLSSASMRQVSHVVSGKSKLCMSHYTPSPPLYPLMPCLVSQMWKSAWMRWDMFCLCLSGITLTEGKRPTLCSAVKGDKYHHLHSGGGKLKWTNHSFRDTGEHPLHKGLCPFVGWRCVWTAKTVSAATHNTCWGRKPLKGDTSAGWAMRWCRYAWEILFRHCQRWGNSLLDWCYMFNKLSITHDLSSFSSSRSLTLNLRSWELRRKRSSIFTTRSSPPSLSSVANISQQILSDFYWLILVLLYKHHWRRFNGWQKMYFEWICLWFSAAARSIRGG